MLQIIEKHYTQIKNENLDFLPCKMVEKINRSRHPAEFVHGPICSITYYLGIIIMLRKTISNWYDL